VQFADQYLSEKKSSGFYDSFKKQDVMEGIIFLCYNKEIHFIT